MGPWMKEFERVDGGRGFRTLLFSKIRSQMKNSWARCRRSCCILIWPQIWTSELPRRSCTPLFDTCNLTYLVVLHSAFCGFIRDDLFLLLFFSLPYLGILKGKQLIHTKPSSVCLLGGFLLVRKTSPESNGLGFVSFYNRTMMGQI